MTVTLTFNQQTIMGAGRGSSSSKRLRMLTSKRTKTKRIDVEKTLTSTGIRVYRAKAFADLQSKLAGKRCLCTVTVSEADEGYRDGWR